MFLSDLVVKRIIGVSNTWQLVEPLIYEYRYQYERENIKVPAGFIFDFASIPKVFWNIFPPDGGRYDRASCIHDWMYSTHMFKRSKCDRIFWKAMIDDGVPEWKADIFWFFVRVFGWLHWGSDDDAAKLQKYIGKDEIMLKDEK